MEICPWLHFRSEAQSTKWCCLWTRFGVVPLRDWPHIWRFPFQPASVEAPLTHPHCPHILSSDSQCMQLGWALFLMFLALQFIQYSFLLSKKKKKKKKKFGDRFLRQPHTTSESKEKGVRSSSRGSKIKPSHRGKWPTKQRTVSVDSAVGVKISVLTFSWYSGSERLSSE